MAQCVEMFFCYLLYWEKKGVINLMVSGVTSLLSIVAISRGADLLAQVTVI